MKDEAIVVLVGIGAVALVAGACILKGIDDLLVKGAFTVIGAMVAYVYGKVKEANNK